MSYAKHGGALPGDVSRQIPADETLAARYPDR